MKRWLWLGLLLAAPLSSPLACGGDGCLRNSDCASDYVCRAGRCELETPPDSESGGEGSDDTTQTPNGGASGGSETSGGSGTSAGRAGGAGSAGVPSVAGSESGEAGHAAASGGSEGEGGAAGEGDRSGGAAGEAGAPTSLGGAP